MPSLIVNELKKAVSELRHAKRVIIITSACIFADSELSTCRGVGSVYSDGKETKDRMKIEDGLAGHTIQTRPSICWIYMYQIESACHLFCISYNYEKHVTNFEGMKVLPDCEHCGAVVRPRIFSFWGDATNTCSNATL
ncbi:unnamed protein product [Adineta steineri]|uniref:Uncharacterized protein n=1 Tax=Adineta steineri TaxID=433720 RepID=A0A819IA10_9BILA|nr:unnamed protein product [Adineta steineri]